MTSGEKSQKSWVETQAALPPSGTQGNTDKWTFLGMPLWGLPAHILPLDRVLTKASIAGRSTIKSSSSPCLWKKSLTTCVWNRSVPNLLHYHVLATPFRADSNHQHNRKIPTLLAVSYTLQAKLTCKKAQETHNTPKTGMNDREYKTISFQQQWAMRSSSFL